MRQYDERCINTKTATIHGFLQIVMTDSQTKEEVKLYTECWLAEDQEDGMTIREFQITRPLDPTRQGGSTIPAEVEVSMCYL